MKPVAIRAEGLSKRYRLGVGTGTHATLRGTAASLAARLRGDRQKRSSSAKDFWALRDATFEVRAGEAVGIIGRNGAGKSTLLKILAGITAPTEGRAEISGRLSALLEVGTGFHRELTGRENIFLNASILGMTRAETASKLESIVDFAGVEQFLDTPVKRYSSGMYLRLAFAVAAHVEPDIMIVDEVLAVGDAEFQKKCLSRIQSAADDGRTVLFVSHQVPLMRTLCSRLIRIDRGAVTADGPTSEIMEAYLQEVESRASEDLATRAHRSGRGQVRISGIKIDSAAGAPTAGAPVRVTFSLSGDPSSVSCSFTIYDEQGNPITYFDSTERGERDQSGEQMSCDIDALLLRPGRYRINAALQSIDGICEDHVEGALLFEVQQGAFDGRLIGTGGGFGSTIIPHRWTRAS